MKQRKKPGPAPGTGGRPPWTPNADHLKLIETLAGVGCTIEEIAGRLGITEQTLHAKLKPKGGATSLSREAYKRGQAKVKSSLRAKQVAVAMNDRHRSQGAMLIWCGKMPKTRGRRPTSKPVAPVRSWSGCWTRAWPAKCRRWTRRAGRG